MPNTMVKMTLVEDVKIKIEKKLPGANVDVIDQTMHHAAHDNNGIHLTVTVTYDGFEGQPLVERHRTIYEILREDLKGKIHALSIKTKVA